VPRRLGLLLVALVVSIAAAVPAGASNDTLFDRQWALTKVSAPNAWARGGDGAGVTVGIVDSGVSLGHEDLAGRIVASTNCIGAGGSPGACKGVGADDVGHGTHVAGIIAADIDNGIGVAGVAPKAQLVIAKALAQDGSGDIDDIGAGIRWVVQHGAKVVNLSLGIDAGAIRFLSNASIARLQMYVNEAWSAGAIPVVAAGNTGSDSTYSNVNAIVVTATDRNDHVASYASSLDSKWGMAAPGGAGSNAPGAGDANACMDVNIVSTYWYSNDASAYACSAGTSMAAPFVSGAAAMLIGFGLSQQQTVDRLLATADKLGPASSYGSGRLDLAAAAAGLGHDPAGAPPATTGTTRPARVRAVTARRITPKPVAATAPTVPTTVVTSPPSTEPPTTVTTGAVKVASAPIAGSHHHDGRTRAIATALVLIGLVVVGGSGFVMVRQRRASASAR